MPGRTTEVTFFGANLNEPRCLWLSFPGTAAFTTNGGTDRLVCRLTLPADAPVSIGAVRLATTKGISSLHLFMVDDLPGVTDRGTNRSPATAQPLTLPVAVDGACDELKVNYYKFTAKKGQRVSVEAVARRLGSALDPVVRVFDTKGRELAYSDDDPALGRDSRCACEIPVNGDYFIEIRDIDYRGGTKHRFHLRVGNFPLVNFPFPFAAKPGAEAKLVFAGRGVEGLKPFSIPVPERAPGNAVPLAAKFANGHGSEPVSLLIGSANELTEIEPNDSPTNSQAIKIPAAINGRFAKPNDRDFFQFDVAKDERLVIKGRTRTLGSPCDLYIELLEADGRRLAVTKLSTNENVSISHTFAEGGTHRLRVEEINRLGGPEMAYRIEIARPQPGFALSVETERVEGVSGGTAELKVTCERNNFDGAITLSCEGLPVGFSLTNNVLTEKSTEVKLKVGFPPDFVAGQIANVHVVGRARVGETEQSVTASTLAALKRLFPDTPYTPAHLDGVIATGLSASPPKPLEETPAPKRKK